MTDSAKTLVLLRRHSMLSVYERGSVYLDHKKFYGGGVSDLCATLYSLHCTVYTVQYTMYSVHRTVYNV